MIELIGCYNTNSGNEMYCSNCRYENNKLCTIRNEEDEEYEETNGIYEEE